MMGKSMLYYALKFCTGVASARASCWPLTLGTSDLEKQTVSISKSYQRIKGQDVITDPKTAKSNWSFKCPLSSVKKWRTTYQKSLYAVEPTVTAFLR